MRRQGVAGGATFIQSCLYVYIFIHEGIKVPQFLFVVAVAVVFFGETNLNNHYVFIYSNETA